MIIVLAYEVRWGSLAYRVRRDNPAYNVCWGSLAYKVRRGSLAEARKRRNLVVL